MNQIFMLIKGLLKLIKPKTHSGGEEPPAPEKNSESKALGKARKKNKPKKRERRTVRPNRTAQKEFYLEIDKLAAQLKRRRNGSLPDDVVKKLSTRLGEPSLQHSFEYENANYVSGLYWLNRNKYEAQDIRRILKLSFTPRGQMYFESKEHVGLLHPLNEAMSSIADYSLALSIIKLRNSGEVPVYSFSEDNEDVIELYFVRNKGMVYVVGVFNGSQLDQAFDFCFDESDFTIDGIYEDIIEPLKENSEDLERVLTGKIYIIDKELLQSKAIRKAKSDFSVESRKKKVFWGFIASVLLIILTISIAVFGYLAYKEKEIEKQRIQELKRQQALIKKKEAEEQLRMESIKALRVKRTQLSSVDVYGPILAKTLRLAKFVSFNRGLDKWVLDLWDCSVTKNISDDSKINFLSSCRVTYKGEALSEPDSFLQYLKLVRKEIAPNAIAKPEATKNYMVLKFSFPLGEIDDDYTTLSSNRFDAIRTLREMQSSLELKKIPLDFYDRGEINIDEIHRNYLLQITSGNQTILPYGYVDWTLKAKINDLAAEDANVVFPPETYITQMLGTYSNITINGIYHYDQL